MILYWFADNTSYAITILLYTVFLRDHIFIWNRVLIIWCGVVDTHEISPSTYHGKKAINQHHFQFSPFHFTFSNGKLIKLNSDESTILVSKHNDLFASVTVNNKRAAIKVFSNDLYANKLHSLNSINQTPIIDLD